MISLDWFKGKKVTVMGLGTHGGGLGIAKWLVRHGVAVTVTDLRGRDALAASIAELDLAVEAAKKKGGKSVKYVLGKHEERDFTDADMVIRNPGVPREHPLLEVARKNGVAIESDISLFFLLCPFPIAAISGTKGKTTTTSILAAICRGHDPRTLVGGNIRISPFESIDELLEMRREGATPPVVLELSSWQLESLESHRISPHVGVLTNILEDHLNRYRDMDDYARAKELLLAFQRPEDVAVVNADNPRTAAIGEGESQIPEAHHAGRRFWFSTEPAKGRDGCFVERGHAVIHDGEKTIRLFPLSRVKILGRHNVGNVLAAAMAAYAMEIPPQVIRREIGAFRGVDGRLQVLGKKHGVTYVNDTTATTPDAAMAAMATFVSGEAEFAGAKAPKKKSPGAGKKRIVLIAGGADKALRFEDWAKATRKMAREIVFFEGTATPKMEEALADAGGGVPYVIVGSMLDAFDRASRLAKKGDVVLLSPGCASFGVFINEFDRGDQFNAAFAQME